MTSRWHPRAWRRAGWLVMLSSLVLAAVTPFAYGAGSTLFDHCAYRAPEIAWRNLIPEVSYFPLGVRCLYQPLDPTSPLIITEPDWGLTLTVYGSLMLLCLGIVILSANRYLHLRGGDVRGRPEPFRRAGGERRGA